MAATKMGEHFYVLAVVLSLSTAIFFTVVTAGRVVDQITCSSSSSCGDLQNISYPFRLQDDPVGCGDPDYQLSCMNN